MEPLIIVIVPIYNVAPYLRKCLDSLNNQTMKQIEVICIDDGSTDRSGIIADEYATAPGAWPEFRIIHTENRGLSAARNLGIDEAQADWLMFVDSDDWVESEFCRVPYKAAVENQADMVIFQNYDSTENGRVKKSARSVQIGLVDHETAVDVGGTASWRRLFKKNLFNEIRYPEGHVFEDYAIMTKVVYKASRIVSLPDRLYYYRFRKNSICHNVSNEEDRLEMSKKRYGDLIDFGYPEEKAQIILLETALKCCGRIEKTDSKLYEDAVGIVESLKESALKLGKRERLLMAAWRLSRSLYRIAYKAVIR